VSPQLLEELNQRKQAQKRAAETPVEPATIEIVALLFQSILTEERIPSAVRVWFARLQMPVLRVAVGEPDFFATVDHPARRLIDRMGACVMGFDASARAVGDALEGEIKRVVQVVEAYPDTGRRVFQTVLTEFERFLEHYFKSENEVTKRGVSLAQQVEQRETLAIQYTIELRKMLNEVPVQEGVRQFLFHVWADVLAMSAVRHGAQARPPRPCKAAHRPDLVGRRQVSRGSARKSSAACRRCSSSCATAWNRPACRPAPATSMCARSTTRWPRPSAPKLPRSRPSASKSCASASKRSKNCCPMPATCSLTRP
jgi:hypothetical protein